jgi:hypothetical protein
MSFPQTTQVAAASAAESTTTSSWMSMLLSLVEVPAAHVVGAARHRDV